MRITLNLASHPYVELRPLYQRLRVVALLLLVTGAMFWWVLRSQQHKAAEAHARASTIESAITQTRNERQGAEASMRQPKNAAVLAQAQFLNNLFLHKSFSWTAVMMDLERVLPPGVQVLNIDPVVAKDGSVTIHMRVAGPRERAVSLVRNLEHSHRFRTPRIVGETAQSPNQNGRPSANFEPVSSTSGVNFDVLAEYNPLEPRETKEAAPGTKAPGRKAPVTKKDATHVAIAGQAHHVARAHKPTPERSTP
jgi:type IV pilus assembly protein PilN